MNKKLVVSVNTADVIQSAIATVHEEAKQKTVFMWTERTDGNGLTIFHNVVGSRNGSKVFAQEVQKNWESGVVKSKNGIMISEDGNPFHELYCADLDNIFQRGPEEI